MLDFSEIRTYPLARRKNKFTLDAMLTPDTEPCGKVDPNITKLAARIANSKEKGARVIAMLGGAVIKEGCGALLIDMMKRGLIDHIAGNGAVSIHDFEIAMIGETSEDVPNGLSDGMFGMAEETGRAMNDALARGRDDGLGYGQSIGQCVERDSLPYRDSSVLYNAVQLGIPVTIHVAIGGDIIHQHPSCDGAVLGETSFRDFKLLTQSVSGLTGGAILNIGSAVNMPEVFLKALTIARNLGHDVRSFCTANFDFIDMYRPRTRLIEWPKTLGCDGYDIRGHHRETIPALYSELVR